MEQNRSLVSRVIEEVWGQGNFTLADELFADNYVGHHPPDESHCPEGVKGYFGTLREAFPDIHFTIEDQIAEGDSVVTRWTARATHQGAFMGIAVTGASGVVTGITINRCTNDKIVEGWTNLHALGLMHQLGVLPGPVKAE